MSEYTFWLGIEATDPYLTRESPDDRACEMGYTDAHCALTHLERLVHAIEP